MKPITYTILFLLFATLVVACKDKKEDPFLVEKDRVGFLDRNTKVDRLENIFEEDSVSESAYQGELRYASTERFNIYDKKGSPLLEITPTLDENRTINSIHILSDKYETKKGISLKSTFGDLRKNYEISDIQSTWNNVVITINELNAYFTIDKRHLDYRFRKNTLLKIEASDIPDKAPIKYFMIGWN